MKKAAFIFFTIVLLSTAAESLRAMELLSTSFKRIFHLLIEPEDLYNPVIQAPFNFWEKGYKATYNFNVKYFDTYAISIDCEKGPNCIPSGCFICFHRGYVIIYNDFFFNFVPG